MPGTTAITYSNTELSVNLANQVTELNRMKDHPYKLVDHIMSNADRVSGGERVIVRWQTDDHSVATRVKHGHEVFHDFAQPTLTPGNQTWGIVVMPVFISEVDEQANKGGVINLLKERTETVENHFKRQFQQVALRGAAASGTWIGVPGWDDFLSLNGADTALGIIEDTANGTNVLHGVNKASFPNTTHEQFHNFFRDLAGNFSTNGLNGLYDSVIDQEIKDGEANPSESFWYWSRQFCALAKRSLRSLEQYTSDGNMDDGARKAHMVYGGCKVTPTVELPNTGAASTGDPWSALRINWKKGVRFRVQSGWDGNFQPFKDLPGTVGSRYALKRLWGQFIGLRPGSCALLVDGEA